MALKYILPNFYDSFFCNLTLAERLLKTKNICGVSGTFPFSIFNGSYNNMGKENVCVYENMHNAIEGYGGLLSNMIIIDYGNPFLETFDYKDLYNKVILEEFGEKPNIYFTISDLEFANYLIEHYPMIQLILHQNYTREHTFTEIQEVLNKYANIKGIITSSFNMCSKIKNVFKIYLLPLHNCEECTQYKKCVEYDNKATLEFSEKSQFSQCQMRELVFPEIIAKRIDFIKDSCDYIMFDTVIAQKELEEYVLIEEVLKIAEE